MALRMAPSEYDEEEQRRQGNSAAAGGGAAPGAAGSGGSPSTFAELQRAGRPRPAPPTPQAQPTPQAPQAPPTPAAPTPAAPTRPESPRPPAAPPTPIPPQQPGAPPTQPPAPPVPAPPSVTTPPATGGRTPPIGPGRNPMTGPVAPPTLPSLTMGEQLMEQWRGYQGPGQFAGSAAQVQAPTFTPGASNITAPTGPSAAPAHFNPQTFNGQYFAVAAPNTRQTGNFNAGGSAFGSQLQQALSGQLSNPSSFNSDAVQQMFQRLSGQIDDEFTQKTRGLEEDMARRGLSESSIRGGRLSDLNVEKRSAKTELGDRLLERMAQTGSADTRAAIQQALGYDESQFGRNLQGHQANLGTNQQNFNQDLVTAAFRGDQQAMELVKNMDIRGFNNAAGQQGYQNQFQNAQLNNQFANDTLSRQTQAGAFNQGLAMDRYNTGMQNAQFQAGQNQQGYQNALTNFQANLGAGQQGFNQQQALLQQLLGYEQQGFENEFQGEQFRTDTEFRNRQLEAAMASMGL